MFNKTIVAVTAAVALGCMPVATNALAADRSDLLNETGERERVQSCNGSGVSKLAFCQGRH